MCGKSTIAQLDKETTALLPQCDSAVTYMSRLAINQQA